MSEGEREREREGGGGGRDHILLFVSVISFRLKRLTLLNRTSQSSSK